MKALVAIAFLTLFLLPNSVLGSERIVAVQGQATIEDKDEDWDDNDNLIEIGHLASREIDVTIRDVSSYSKIMQALVDVGVTRISGASAEISNYEELQLEALGEAVKDARMKAQFLAGQLDAKIARVHRIGDNNVYDNYGLLEKVVVTGSSGALPAPYEFEIGTIDVHATIHVEFELE